MFVCQLNFVSFKVLICPFHSLALGRYSLIWLSSYLMTSYFVILYYCNLLELVIIVGICVFDDKKLNCIGICICDQVGNRIIKKRIHVRVEHVQPSRCTEEFKLRKKKNDELKADAKARGEVISTKRQPKGPKPGFMVEGATLETVTPIPYDVVNDLKGGY